MPEIAINVEYSRRLGRMAQRTVNLYPEKTPNGPKKYAMFPRPGLEVKMSIGDGPIRCSVDWHPYGGSQHKVVVSGSEVYVDEVLIGVIPGDDLCRKASSEDYLVIVSEGKAYNVTTTTVTQITDPDIFSNVVDVVYLAGRFVYFDGDSSQFQWSDIGDPTVIDGLSFATADENESNQVCKAAVILVDDMVILLSGATEWWSAADSGDAPFVRSPGRRYNKGIISRSTGLFMDNTVIFVGSDKQVYRASAVPQRISSHDVEELIGKVPDNELENLSALVAEFAGHIFYVLYIPGYGSWAFDAASQKWVEWLSWEESRFRCQLSDGTLLGDYENGYLYKFNPEVYTDNGSPIEKICSAYLPVPSSHYPIDNLYLNTPRGVGVLGGDDPVVEMRFSDQEGSKFSNWRNAPLGASGDTDDGSKAIWNFVGAARAPGRLFEFRCSDPVYFSPSSIVVNQMLP